MTSAQLITAISNSEHPELLKAQCISIIRDVWVDVPRPIIKLPHLFSLVCEVMNVPMSQAFYSRKREFSRARQMFCWYLDSRYYQVYCRRGIGEFLKGRDYSTIIANVKAMEKLIFTDDPAIEGVVETLDEIIENENYNQQEKQIPAAIENLLAKAG